MNLNKKNFVSLVLLSTAIVASCSNLNSVENQNILGQMTGKDNDNKNSFEIKKIISPKKNVSSSTFNQYPTQRIISFSGYDWNVRSTKSTIQGPGPNYFSNSEQNVFLDSLGHLHLKIINRNGKWYCSEVDTVKSLGYGKYKFYLASRVDQIPINSVLGLFTYDNEPDYNHREIDIEFAKWGYSASPNTQYTVQSSSNYSSSKGFATSLQGDYTTHTFDWTPSRINFESYHGQYANLPDPNYLINYWSYTGSGIPLKGNEKAIINLWNFQQIAPAQEIEVVISKFEFVPSTNL